MGCCEFLSQTYNFKEECKLHLLHSSFFVIFVYPNNIINIQNNKI